MPDVLLFVEDSAQEKFISALLHRLAAESGIELHIRVRSSRGGYAKVLGQLSDFSKEAEDGKASLPDGLVVAVDANCRGYVERRDAVAASAGRYAQFVVHAIPDPHIERWFLLDSAAFRTVLGRGCRAPDEKCEKQRYKRLLNAAVIEAGVQPLLGGVEYAEDIAATLDIRRTADMDQSFARFVGEFRTWTNARRQRAES